MVCQICQLPLDDHDGLYCASTVHRGSVRIFVTRPGHSDVEVEMEAATGVGYAAKRAAAALGFNDDRQYRLKKIGCPDPIPDDMPIVLWASDRLDLVVPSAPGS